MPKTTSRTAAYVKLARPHQYVKNAFVFLPLFFGWKLTDPAALRGEQEGTRALFAGAYAVLRNPSGHRDVDFSDPSEAAESVATASLLMRVLDRIEARLNT